MQIKTITCHRVYNYGASLQAYALQHYLEEKGHHVEIIDFWPYAFHGRYNFFYVNSRFRYFSLLQRFPVLKFFYGLRFNRRMFKTYGRKGSFDKFEKQFLHLTDMSYSTSDALKKEPPFADVYIAGSDQIWNTDMPNGHESAFYLDFGDKTIHRIAYAASFGIPSVPDEYKNIISNRIHKLDFVSVREASGLNILKNMGIENAVQVLDPVFLLSADEWRKCVLYDSKHYHFIDDKYILIYDFIGDSRIKQLAINAAQNLKCKLVSLNDFRTYHYVDYNINNAGPCEFLNLIEHACLVITNSFHATAFSVIFNKEFYTFSLSTQNSSSRMEDFCHLLNLMERYNSTQIADNKISYHEVNRTINEQKYMSMRFINMGINFAEGL